MVQNSLPAYIPSTHIQYLLHQPRPCTKEKDFYFALIRRQKRNISNANFCEVMRKIKEAKSCSKANCHFPVCTLSYLLYNAHRLNISCICLKTKICMATCDSITICSPLNVAKEYRAFASNFNYSKQINSRLN